MTNKINEKKKKKCLFDIKLKKFHLTAPNFSNNDPV